MKRKTKRKKQEPAWTDVETIITSFDKDQLTELVRDLYYLSDNTKNFFHTRFLLAEDPLAPYKKTIQQAIHPYLEDNEPLDIENAENAVSLYSKSTDNPRGMAELTIFYTECGNNFTLSYGDMGEGFYDSLLEMYEYAVEAVRKLPADEQNEYRDRLHKVMKSASDIDWEYYDAVRDLYFHAFSHES